MPMTENFDVVVRVMHVISSSSFGVQRFNERFLLDLDADFVHPGATKQGIHSIKHLLSTEKHHGDVIVQHQHIEVQL
jgi:hypothetical protein